jgi:rhodanese-related sulfurtransferase
MTTLLSALIGAGAGYAYYHYIGCISGTCPIQTNPYLSTIFGAVMAMLILPDGINWVKKTWDEKRGTMDVSSASLAGQPARVTYSNINRDEFFAQKDQPNTMIIDVRTKMEWNMGHVAGATLIDINSADFDAKIDQLDKSKTYLVYCRSGNRSSTAANIMIKKGFTDVKNVRSGQAGLF